MNELEQRVQSLTEEIARKDAELRQKDVLLQLKDGDLRQKDELLRQKDEQLRRKDSLLQSLCTKKDAEIDALTRQLKEQQAQLAASPAGMIIAVSEFGTYPGCE